MLSTSRACIGNLSANCSGLCWMTMSSTTDSGSSNDAPLLVLVGALRSTAVLTTTNSFLGEMDVTFDTGRTVRSARLYACFFVLLAGVCHAQIIKLLSCFTFVCTCVNCCNRSDAVVLTPSLDRHGRALEGAGHQRLPNLPSPSNWTR